MVNILYYFNTKKNYKSEKIIADFLLIIQHNPKFESNLSRSKRSRNAKQIRIANPRQHQARDGRISYQKQHQLENKGDQFTYSKESYLSKTPEV